MYRHHVMWQVTACEVMDESGRGHDVMPVIANGCQWRPVVFVWYCQWLPMAEWVARISGDQRSQVTRESIYCGEYKSFYQEDYFKPAHTSNLGKAQYLTIIYIH
jgi:hypothetical protein